MRGRIVVVDEGGFGRRGGGGGGGMFDYGAGDGEFMGGGRRGGGYEGLEDFVLMRGWGLEGLASAGIVIDGYMRRDGRKGLCGLRKNFLS